MPIAKSTRLGPYEVITPLGSGGMGEVYLAEDARLQRKVALKILPADFASDRNRMHRFNQEAMAAAALNHPHIAHIYEIGQAADVHFIAMEYIDGDTLRRRINQGIKLLEILEMGSQASSALVAAHGAGIIHRDIKPENLMVRRDGYIKLLDFGLAKLSERDWKTVDTDAPTKAMVNTDVGTVIGTANYMSPEQAKGTAVDPRTDLWSLGVVLYEMVTGHVPFRGETAAESISLILQKDPAPLTRFAHDVPPELERIVTKALTKDREERYQTAKDMLIDLRNLRRKLEVDAEIERTAAPELRQSASTTSGQSAPATASVAGAATVPASAGRPSSSAEYIVSRIQQHKLFATIGVVMLVITIVGLGVYLHARKTELTFESIAVLPFVNQNNDPSTEYLSDGIPESIINSLSQLPNLKVMSRNSVFHYKGMEMDAQTVAKELKVQAVLTGRVTQRGDGLSINVELINAQDNSQIWGQQYNRKLADVFAVQEEIAKEISYRLRLKLVGEENRQLAKRPTENIKAFQYYMQGRAYTQRRTREDLLTAVRYCEKAIEEDQKYALAYAGLADAYANLGIRGYIAPIEGRRKVEEAARKALALDDNLAEAHVAFAQVHCYFAPYNFSLGDRELRRAIELSPSLALAHYYLGLSLVRQGRLDESLEEFLKARELDPLSSIIARNVAFPYYLKRDYVRSDGLLRQANDLGPALSTTWEIGVYIQNRSFKETMAELEKAKREMKNDSILIYDTGMVYAAHGMRSEALQIIKDLEAMSGANLSQAHWIAKIYAVLNEKELALMWLERGLATGAIGAFYKDEPAWDAIRSDPRFADILRRMGIP
jgi:serine/threonine protein kinase/Tfp pilus assembly protein PilF